MNHADLERRIRQMTWPEPSEELRARVLSSPVAAVRSASWSDHVWFSRAWRFSAAGVFAVLVALESWSSPPVPARVQLGAHAPATVLALDDTGRDLGLPAGVVPALARPVRPFHAWPDLTGQEDWATLPLLDGQGDRR